MLPPNSPIEIGKIYIQMLHQESNKHGVSPSYIKSVIKYYFSPKLRSVLTILYFLFFLYFVIFYISHIFLAVRFIFRTLFSSTVSWGPDYMIWGSIFIVCLVIPFLASIFALVLPYEMRMRAWPRSTRFVLVGITAFVMINFIMFVDFSIGYVEKKPPIKTFMDEKGIGTP